MSEYRMTRVLPRPWEKNYFPGVNPPIPDDALPPTFTRNFPDEEPVGDSGERELQKPMTDEEVRKLWNLARAGIYDGWTVRRLLCERERLLARVRELERKAEGRPA